MFRERKVYFRLQKLHAHSQRDNVDKADLKREYDKLDTLRGECMTLAEKRCRKFKRGGVLWSLRIQEAQDTILFWTLLRKKRRKCLVSTRHILRLKKRLKITGELSLSDPAVHDKLSEAYVTYK